MKPRINEILERLLELHVLLEARKRLFTEQDMLVVELQALGFQNGELDEYVLTLKDNFELSNTAWRPAAVKRYELVVKEKKS